MASGTYPEQLVIRRKGIHVHGQDAKLVAPDSFKSNTCTGEAGPGSQAGICIHGGGLTRSPFYSQHRKVIAVKRPVKNVSIIGMVVSGFSGANIMLIGTADLFIANNTLIDGPMYGYLSAGCGSTAVTDNIVTSSTPESSGFIAMGIDDINGADALRNHITNYQIGLYAGAGSGYLQDNVLSSTCRAIFVGPSTYKARILHNRIGTSLSSCGDFGAYGITLDGSNTTKVQRNIIQDQQSSNGPAGGILIVDDPCSELSPSCDEVNRTAVAFGNKVKQNMLLNNQLDIYKNTTGKLNKIKPNKCSTSIPTRLCQK